MSKIPEYRRGYRDGLRWSVSWLHARAAEMNDPHAKALLNSAATNLGWDIEKQLDGAAQVSERAADLADFIINRSKD